MVYDLAWAGMISNVYQRYVAFSQCRITHVWITELRVVAEPNVGPVTEVMVSAACDAGFVYRADHEPSNPRHWRVGPTLYETVPLGLQRGPVRCPACHAFCEQMRAEYRSQILK